MSNELMRKALEALRSGEFKQVRVALYDRIYDEDRGPTDEFGYCCLGVMDRVCFGATFSLTGQGSYADDEGSEASLSDERAAALGLNATITLDEQNYIISKLGIPVTHGLTSRQRVLWKLNDEKNYTFKEIADFIEGMGW